MPEDSWQRERAAKDSGDFDDYDGIFGVDMTTPKSKYTQGNHRACHLDRQFV